MRDLTRALFYILAIAAMSLQPCFGQMDTAIILIHYNTEPFKDTIDIDESNETDIDFDDLFEEEFPEDFDFPEAGGCPNTIGCEEPEAKDLANKFITLYSGCHSGGGLPCTAPLGIKNIKSDPAYRVLRYSALFHKSAIYETDDIANQADWNKLGSVYSRQCGATQYSVRLGWRSRFSGDGITPAVSENLIEYALYGHIDHRDQSPCNDGVKGREAVRIPGVFTTEAFLTPISGVSYGGWPTELVLYERGFFVRVGSKGVAIRRDFTQEASSICEPAKTKIRKSVYFGGDETAPHKMEFKLDDMKLDNPPTWWTHTTYKGFCRSEWYSDDVQTIVANERIELNLPVDATVVGGPQDNYVTFHDGCDITFITPDLVPDLSQGGFPAGSGIDVEVGATVEHILGTTTIGVNTGEVFDYSCPGNGKKDDDDGNDYIFTETSEEEQEDELQPNDINETSGISLHPNPTSGEFQLTVGSEQEAQVYIYDIFGRLIYNHHIISSTNQHINISQHPKGIYLIKVIQVYPVGRNDRIGGEKVYLKKLIHQ